jgi:hypothetical protein
MWDRKESRSQVRASDMGYGDVGSRSRNTLGF